MKLAHSQISFRSRAGHLALLIISAFASVAMASLLATEEGVPMRATVALAGILSLNLIWMAYAAWVLTARQPMLLNHRVVAGRISVAATAAFTLGSAAIGIATGATSGWMAALLGIGLLSVAVTLLIRARRDFRALQLRRATLEARLREISE
jgi:hypothetical protein